MRKPKNLEWKFKRSKWGNSTTTKEKFEGAIAGLLIGTAVVTGVLLIASGLAKVEVK